MTVKDLLSFFENYYGEKYTGVFLDAMSSYLSDCSPCFRKAAAEVLIKRVSRSFGKSPCLAEIEKHKSEILNHINKPVALPEQTETEEERENNIALWEQLMQRYRVKNKMVEAHKNELQDMWQTQQIRKLPPLE